MKNYFDKNGNYINVENLSLVDIYKRAAEEGYRKGYTDACIEMVREMVGTDSGSDLAKLTDDLYAKLIGGGK